MNVIQALESAGPGGAEKLLLQLCRRLRSRGHAVRALLLRTGWLAEQLRDSGIEVRILPIARALDPRFLRALRDYIATSGADLFHSHEFTLGIYGRAATATLAVPHVATAHGKNFSGGLKRRLLGATLLRRRKRFRLVAVSGSLAGYLAGGLALPRRAIELIPNGVDVTPRSEPRPRSDAEPLRLVAVGNLYPVKNHALLIRAVAALRERGVEARLDILGRGDEEVSLRERIDSLGLADRVVLGGFREDVESYLSRAHVFVSSSLSEGMPLSLLEAMAAGLPVVASEVGGVPELVVAGETGLLYPSNDLNRLVDALSGLARDETHRRRLGRNASRRVAAEFSLDRTVERYEELYARLEPARGA